MPLNSVSVNAIPTLILRSVCLVGMNMYMRPRLHAASDAHYLWCQWNKRKFGPLFDLMRRTRAKYKYAIRYYCRQQEKQIQADTLAQYLSKQLAQSLQNSLSIYAQLF